MYPSNTDIADKSLGSFAFLNSGPLSALGTQAVGGTVSVLNASAASWISLDGLYLYSDYLGDDKIVSYAISSTGALTKINQQAIGTATGWSLQRLVGI